MTDREQVALEMLKGNAKIIYASDTAQVGVIADALSFAELFLDMAKDENSKGTSRDRS